MPPGLSHTQPGDTHTDTHTQRHTHRHTHTQTHTQTHTHTDTHTDTHTPFLRSRDVSARFNNLIQVILLMGWIYTPRIRNQSRTAHDMVPPCTKLCSSTNVPSYYTAVIHEETNTTTRLHSLLQTLSGTSTTLFTVYFCLDWENTHTVCMYTHTDAHITCAHKHIHMQAQRVCRAIYTSD